MTIQNVNDTADIQYHAQTAMKSLQNFSVGNLSAKQLRILEGVQAQLAHIEELATKVNESIGNAVCERLASRK
jgi:hypothetical protein